MFTLALITLEKEHMFFYYFQVDPKLHFQHPKSNVINTSVRSNSLP
mgnify:CR=1 FL=1